MRIVIHVLRGSFTVIGIALLWFAAESFGVIADDLGMINGVAAFAMVAAISLPFLRAGITGRSRLLKTMERKLKSLVAHSAAYHSPDKRTSSEDVDGGSFT
jgi:hypothetical protein